MLKTTREIIRKIAIQKQLLSGPKIEPTIDGLMQVMENLRCLQIDPIRAVERTQYLVLFSRMGRYDPAILNQAAYEHKLIFEYWAHAASYVLTKDYPLHQHAMKNYEYGTSAWAQRFEKWVNNNLEYERYILNLIRKNGKIRVSQIDDSSVNAWESSGWSNNRNAAMMISSLWDRGKIMVDDRKGLYKYWNLTENVLPDWTPDSELIPFEVTYQAAQLSLQALGIGTLKHIRNHFTRKRYPELKKVVDELVSKHLFIPVEISDGNPDWNKAGPWYIHSNDIELLKKLSGDNWHPRTSLLSPFDNLICDRERTELIWDFSYRIEIYVPPKKRKFGYYVLPILSGDKLIGRISPKMDRKQSRLYIEAVYKEPGAPQSKKVMTEIRSQIEALGKFLGAKEVVFGKNIPTEWQEITK